MKTLINALNKELEEVCSNVQDYKIQDHQRVDSVRNDWELKNSILSDKIGLTNNLNDILDIIQADISIVRMKEALYGDSVNDFTDDGLLNQILIKVIRLKAMNGMKQDCAKVLSEIRTYTAFMFNCDIERVYSECVCMLPYKELNYASGWIEASFDSLVELIVVKLKRHIGQGKAKGKKLFSDLQDLINYTFYLQLKQKRGN